MSDVAPSSSAVQSAIGPIHSASEQGYSHAANALYDQGRPAYSDEAIDFLLQRTVLGPLLEQINAASAAAASSPATVAAASASPATAASASAPRVIRLIDVGAGTGIFTRCLFRRVQAFTAAHSAQLQALQVSIEVSAVEPVAGMRQRFTECCPAEISVQEGSGASMPGVASGSVDVVFAAQAFHWFATAECLRELARVLRSDRASFFCPLWNNRDLSVPWVAALETQIITPAYPADVPRQQTRQWRQVFELDIEGAVAGVSKPFTLAAEKSWVDGSVTQRGGVDMVLARVLSLSVVAALDKAGQEQVEQRVRELLASHPDTKGKEQLELPYVTDAFVFQRAAGDNKA